MSLTKVTYSMVKGAPVNVIDYVTSGSGTDDDPYVGWDTQIEWLPNTKYIFPSGVFIYDSIIDVAQDGIWIQGVGVGTVLKYTGTSGNVALRVDRAGLTGVSNVTIEGMLLKGNATTDYGMYISNVRNLTLRDINVVDVTKFGVDINCVVLGLIENYTCTINAGLATFMPSLGLRIDSSGIYGSTFSSEITVINPIIEGVSGDGIHLGRAIFCKIINGTSEANNVGVRFVNNGGAGLNTIDGTDCESNTTADFIIGGVNNILRGVISGSAISDAIVISSTGIGTLIDGGHAENLTNSGVATEIINFALTPGGSFTDTGTKTIIHSLYDYNTNQFMQTNDNPNNLLYNGSVEAWSSGTSSAPDGWVLSGAGATVSRSVAHVKIGTYSAAVTRVGADCSLSQALIASEYTVSALIGRKLCFSAWVWSSVANTTRLHINTIAFGAVSEYHPGDSQWHLLTVSATIPAGSSACATYMAITTVDTTSYIDGATLNFGSIPVPYVDRPVAAAHATGGTGSAGAGKQYVSVVIDGITYKLLHDN